MSDLSLPSYKQELIQLLIESNALKFGDFTTKSGRRTPYFVNLGTICDGHSMRRLGHFYAHALHARFGDGFDNLFGPAYKGIPLAAGTAAALAELYGRNVTYTFNRKEAKDHGEGGLLIGHAYQDGDRVVIIEDVVTAGTSVRESLKLLQQAARIQLTGVIVAVDRQERGVSPRSALTELAAEHQVPAFAIVTLDEIIGWLHGREVNGRVVIDDALLAVIKTYRERYGATPAPG